MNKEVTQLLELVRHNNYRNLIFDLDRTITKLEMPWNTWITRVTAALPPEAGKKLTDIIAAHGPWGEVVNKRITEDPEFYKQFIKICQDFEEEHFAHTPYSDLIRALPQLKADGAELSLWTSNTRRTAERALLEMGILHLFRRLITREDTKLGKPDREGWEKLKRPGQALGSYLMVGDSENDELAAKEAGIAYYDISFFKKG